ncbi:MAG: hypothetical protein DELT_00529 [Desulfovibrio sp.]
MTTKPIQLSLFDTANQRIFASVRFVSEMKSVLRAIVKASGLSREQVAGKNWTVIAGDNATIEAGKEATLKAGSIANIVAPLINLCGRIFCKSVDGKGKGYAEFEGDVVIKGSQEVTENTTVGGNSTVAGNSQASSRSGGSCPH